MDIHRFIKSSTYEFVVTNKTDKLVGFWLQDGKSHKKLEQVPIEAGQTHRTRVKISIEDFRYRCPINPTPWYDVAVGN